MFDTWLVSYIMLAFIIKILSLQYRFEIFILCKELSYVVSAIAIVLAKLFLLQKWKLTKVSTFWLPQKRVVDSVLLEYFMFWEGFGMVGDSSLFFYIVLILRVRFQPGIYSHYARWFSNTSNLWCLKLCRVAVISMTCKHDLVDVTLKIVEIFITDLVSHTRSANMNLQCFLPTEQLFCSHMSSESKARQQYLRRW